MTITGATTETSPSSGIGGRHDRDHPGRLRRGEVEVRARPRGWRCRATEAILSDQPAYQTSRSIGRVHRLQRGLLAPSPSPSANCAAPALQHLGDPVEDLPAVVGGGARPAGERLARGHHRVPGVLARGPGRVGEEVALGRGHGVGPPALRARELPADEQLVGLAYGTTVLIAAPSPHALAEPSDRHEHLAAPAHAAAVGVPAGAHGASGAGAGVAAGGLGAAGPATVPAVTRQGRPPVRGSPPSRP